MITETVIQILLEQVARLAKMPVEDAKIFLSGYLEHQFTTKNTEKDEYVEAVFQTVAEKQLQSVEEVKKQVYEVLKKA